jgi:hypothetical protein
MANVLESTKRWGHAYKSRCRLLEMDKAAHILNQWANEGYIGEQPLFFARAVLHLLADNKILVAADLLRHSTQYVKDNFESSAEANPACSPGLAVWHVATILTELVNFPPLQRVDKLKLFSMIYNRYVPLLVRIDTKLVDILNRIGENAFGYQPQGPTNARANPMSILQGLLGGGGGGFSAAAPSSNAPMKSGPSLARGKTL